MLVVYPLPPGGGRLDIRLSVGVDCFLRYGRLAMPAKGIAEFILRFFIIPKCRRKGDAGTSDTHEKHFSFYGRGRRRAHIVRVL